MTLSLILLLKLWTCTHVIKVTLVYSKLQIVGPENEAFNLWAFFNTLTAT